MNRICLSLLYLSITLGSQGQDIKCDSYKAYKGESFDIKKIYDQLSIPGSWKQTCLVTRSFGLSKKEAIDSSKGYVLNFINKDTLNFIERGDFVLPNHIYRWSYKVNGRTLTMVDAFGGNRYEILYLDTNTLILKWYEQWGPTPGKSGQRKGIVGWGDEVIRTVKRNEIWVFAKQG